MVRISSLFLLASGALLSGLCVQTPQVVARSMAYKVARLKKSIKKGDSEKVKNILSTIPLSEEQLSEALEYAQELVSKQQEKLSELDPSLTMPSAHWERAQRLAHLIKLIGRYSLITLGVVTCGAIFCTALVASTLGVAMLATPLWFLTGAAQVFFLPFALIATLSQALDFIGISLLFMSAGWLVEWSCAKKVKIRKKYKKLCNAQEIAQLLASKLNTMQLNVGNSSSNAACDAF